MTLRDLDHTIRQMSEQEILALVSRAIEGSTAEAESRPSLGQANKLQLERGKK